MSEILGELTTIVTLRIVILRSKTTPFSEIKDKLLKLLVLQSHAVLRSTGCPLDEVSQTEELHKKYLIKILSLMFLLLSFDSRMDGN